MEVFIPIGIFVLAVVLFFNGVKRKKSTGSPITLLSANDLSILQQYVPFYAQLDEAGKHKFEQRVLHFLSDITITGANTQVEQLDKLLIAASAVIPTFGFDDWEYPNIDEVIVYPETFGDDFEQQGEERSILGMVGWGVMNNTMVISQHELRQGFINKTGKNNTAIHEFVHLLDKADGAVDGIPENLMDKAYVKPWLNLMHQKIAAMQAGKTDINMYGATNQAEFFAVVAEYFFERPDLLRKKHPDLYELMNSIFSKNQPNK